MLVTDIEMPGLTGLELALRIQRQVLRLAGEGRSAGEIAMQLNLSPGTVRNYLSEAIGKLGSTNLQWRHSGSGGPEGAWTADRYPDLRLAVDPRPAYPRAATVAVRHEPLPKSGAAGSKFGCWTAMVKGRRGPALPTPDSCWRAARYLDRRHRIGPPCRSGSRHRASRGNVGAPAQADARQFRPAFLCNDGEQV